MSIKINLFEYKIIEELGVGGFGKVYKVLNEEDNQYYAIKEISIKDEKEEIITNIKKEAEILSKFNSKNIVKYYGSSQDKEKFYILMEYCDGMDLKNFIDEYKGKNQIIEEKILLDIIRQLCTGIKEIHDKNIIHRDLKLKIYF